MTNVIELAQDLISGRLKEIDEEKARLEKALAELGGNPRRKPGRPKGSTASAATGAGGSTAKKRRRRKGGSHREEVLKLVTENPGIQTNAVAKKLKVKPNYLYKIVGELKEEGALKADGRKLSVA